MFASRLIAIVFVFFSISASAIPILPDLDLDLHEIMGDKTALQVIRETRIGKQRIKPGGVCEAILLDAVDRLGRRLTHAEIRLNIEVIVKATGESLVSVVPPSPQPRPVVRDGSGCFTAAMKVTTPSGDRAISELRLGDEVISIDLQTMEPRANRIFGIKVHRNRPVGRLSDLPTPIEVTGRHRFLSNSASKPTDFYPIEELDAGDNLFLVKPGACTLSPFLRGSYSALPGAADVYELELIGEPRNYIVEGILVHNIKM